MMIQTKHNDKHMSELPWPVVLQRMSCLIHNFYLTFIQSFSL